MLYLLSAALYGYIDNIYLSIIPENCKHQNNSNTTTCS